MNSLGGGRWSLYSMEGGQFDPHFSTAPGGHNSFIILFKERINDHIEKLGQFLENWPKYCNFVGQEILRKFLKISFFKLEITVLGNFLRY